MTDMGNHNFAGDQGAAQPAGAGQQEVDNARLPIGVVLEISGAGSQIALDLQRLTECTGDDDPSIALAGQVGSQIKIRVGDAWLLANVRDQRKDRRNTDGIIAHIDAGKTTATPNFSKRHNTRSSSFLRMISYQNEA